MQNMVPIDLCDGNHIGIERIPDREAGSVESG
jgi:hypothetical protein